MNSYNQIHLVYFSPTGTTAQVLHSIASSMPLEVVHHDLTLPENRKSLPAFSPKDLVILGIPVYGGRIPEIVESDVKGLIGQNTPAVNVAVYGNRHYNDALLEMDDYLSAQGFVTIAAGAFIGEHSFTSELATKRPHAQDLKDAQDFGNAVYSILESGTVKSISANIPGNRPYRERKPSPPLGPIASEACRNCGVCAKTCPSGALSMKPTLSIDETRCIRCHKCVRVCSNKALSINGYVDNIRKFLLENFSEPRTTELFLPKSL